MGTPNFFGVTTVKQGKWHYDSLSRLAACFSSLLTLVNISCNSLLILVACT